MKREPYGLREYRIERIDEIWALIGKGWTDAEIAEELELKRGVMSRDLNELYKRHGVNSRVKLALKWHGLPFRTI